MSDKATQGSHQSRGDYSSTSKNNTSTATRDFSAYYSMDNYSRRVESYEQIVLGNINEKAEDSIRRHTTSMKKKLKDVEKSLPK